MAAQSPDFYNYSKLGEVRDPARENPPFAWPGVNIKNINGPFGNDSVKLSRGFMRSILTDSSIVNAFSSMNEKRQTSVVGDSNQSHYRLNFQFNPEYIERSVSQTIGAVNPILQSVSNLTQPIPGSATFNFTMTFNREMEVAAAANRRDSQTLWEGNIGPDNEDSRLFDPGLVGVWADIRMFDLIVGQGITQELIDLVSAFTKTQSYERANNTASASAGGPSGAEGTEGASETTSTDEGLSLSNEEIKERYSANLGNSAFLNPLPVRIVFSDTFMVEGMVTGTAVAFQKFNHRMIPTICQINVSFTAMYVGFARKNAFLTDQLTAWAKDEAYQASQQVVTDNSNARVAANSITQLVIYPNSKLFISGGYGRPGWSEKFNPDATTNPDQFLAHSLANAKVSNTSTRYPETPTTLERWYNVKKTFLYKNGINITNSVLALYSEQQNLPFVIGVLYNQRDTDTKNPTFSFKVELIYKYPNPETGVRDKELTAACTFLKTKDVYFKQFGAGKTAGFTPMTYQVEGSLDIGKISNLPKINSLLVGTENIPFGDNQFVALRITPTVEILSGDGSSKISTELNPIDYFGISWNSDSANTAANVVTPTFATVTVADPVDGPREFRPADRI